MDKEEKALSALLQSYQARQSKIKNSDLVNFTQGVRSGFDSMIAKLNSFLGISALPLIPIIIGVLLVAGVTAWAVWEYFQADAKASAIDLQKASELSRLLEKVDPKVKDKVLKEINTYGDEQHQKGFQESQAKSPFSFLSFPVVIAAGAGIFLATRKNGK